MHGFGFRVNSGLYLFFSHTGMLLMGPLAENNGFPTVLVLTTGLVLLASSLALMLEKKQKQKSFKQLS